MIYLARDQRRDCARSGRNNVDEAVARLQPAAALAAAVRVLRHVIYPDDVRRQENRHERFLRDLSGVGTALIAVIGFGWFKEPMTTLKIVSIVLIVAGVLGLNAGVRAG
jgi:hypothetical protein